MTISTEKKREVEANYEAFKALLPNLLSTHPGKFALLRHKEVVTFFDTPRDALIFAIKTYPDDAYSIQEVTNKMIDLGWFSNARDYAEVRA